MLTAFLHSQRYSVLFLIDADALPHVQTIFNSLKMAHRLVMTIFLKETVFALLHFEAFIFYFSLALIVKCAKLVDGFLAFFEFFVAFFLFF